MAPPGLHVREGACPGRVALLLQLASGQIATHTCAIEKNSRRAAEPPEGRKRPKRGSADRPRLLAQRLRRGPFLLVAEDRAPVPMLGEGHTAFDADPDPL